PAQPAGWAFHARRWTEKSWASASTRIASKATKESATYDRRRSLRIGFDLVRTDFGIVGWDQLRSKGGDFSPRSEQFPRLGANFCIRFQVIRDCMKRPAPCSSNRCLFRRRFRAENLWRNPSERVLVQRSEGLF